MKENVKINRYDNAVKSKTIKENCAKQIEKLTLNLHHQTLHKKTSNWTGICYTLFLDTRNDGSCGTIGKPQDQPMAQIHSNGN